MVSRLTTIHICSVMGVIRRLQVRALRWSLLARISENPPSPRPIISINTSGQLRSLNIRCFIILSKGFQAVESRLGDASMVGGAVTTVRRHCLSTAIFNPIGRMRNSTYMLVRLTLGRSGDLVLSVKVRLMSTSLGISYIRRLYHSVVFVWYE